MQNERIEKPDDLGEEWGITYRIGLRIGRWSDKAAAKVEPEFMRESI